LHLQFLFLFTICATRSNQGPRFGNYIGEADSDEEQNEQVPEAFKFDEAFDDEEEEEDVNDQQLMEVDGKLCCSAPRRASISIPLPVR
jgi:hypothetical protein